MNFKVKNINIDNEVVAKVFKYNKKVTPDIRLNHTGLVIFVSQKS